MGVINFTATSLEMHIITICISKICISKIHLNCKYLAEFQDIKTVIPLGEACRSTDSSIHDTVRAILELKCQRTEVPNGLKCNK